MASRRQAIRRASTHVNWWDHVEHGAASDTPDAIDRKRGLVYQALKRITRISVDGA